MRKVELQPNLKIGYANFYTQAVRPKCRNKMYFQSTKKSGLGRVLVQASPVVEARLSLETSRQISNRRTIRIAEGRQEAGLRFQYIYSKPPNPPHSPAPTLLALHLGPQMQVLPQQLPRY
jgi:hypothetical protein